MAWSTESYISLCGLMQTGRYILKEIQCLINGLSMQSVDMLSPPAGDMFFVGVLADNSETQKMGFVNPTTPIKCSNVIKPRNISRFYVLCQDSMTDTRNIGMFIKQIDFATYREI